MCFTLNEIDIVFFTVFLQTGHREALPTDLTLQLVDSICACCRIAVVALKASIVAIEACDTPPPLAQVLTQTYLGVLDYCRGFMSILSSSQQLSRVVRKRY